MPTLKSYSFTRINEYGASENCYATFRAMSFDWQTPVFYAEFRNYESAEEAARGSVSREGFNLKLETEQLLSILLQPIPEEEKDLPFLEIFSNRIWAIAEVISFIPDYSEIDAETNLRVRQEKSLMQLNASLIEVEL